MLEVNYEYKKGALFVRLDGNLDIKNIYLLINSIRQVIKIGGISYTIINLEKVKALNDSYIRIILDELKNSGVYICGYNSNNYGSDKLLVNENSIYNYVML